MQSIMKFLGEVRNELSQVEWPSKKEWVGATLITLILVLIAALFLGIVDRFFSLIIRQIFSFFA